LKILLDPDYGLLVTVIGCILAIVAIWQAYKYKTRKKLEFQIWTIENLIKIDKNELSDVILSYQKKGINRIDNLEFYFKNEGNSSLTTTEIIEPILIKFEKPIKVLEARILSTERSNKYVIEINKDEIKILPNFIEIGEIFKIAIKVADFSENIPTVSYKIIGGIDFRRRLFENPIEEISLGLAKFGSDFGLYILIFLAFVHLQLFLFIKIFKLNVSNMQFLDELIKEIFTLNFTSDIVISIISIISFSIFPLILCKNYYDISKPYYLHMKEINKWILK
jgi:hypothetical protein